jgi:recombination protein RecT
MSKDKQQGIQKNLIEPPNTGPYPDIGKAPEPAAAEPTVQPATTLAPPRRKDMVLRDLLDRSAEQIALALPKHLTPERMIRMAMTVFHRSPELQRCAPMSIVACVIQASELGLELSGPLGQAWMVPYKEQATFQVGYKGYFELAYRSGKVCAFPMRVVYEKDHFEIEYGTNQQLVHRPCLKGPRGDVIGYYGCCYLKDGNRDFEFMSVSDIEEHYRKYVRNKRADSPWVTARDAMALKTCVRMLAKRVPLSTEFRTAARYDETGDQGLPPPHDASDGTPLLRVKDEETGYVREREAEFFEEQPAT